MIISCPSCQTRFTIDLAALGPEGRMVRCARCRHSWFQEPPDETAPDLVPAPGTPDGETEPPPSIVIDQPSEAGPELRPARSPEQDSIPEPDADLDRDWDEPAETGAGRAAMTGVGQKAGRRNQHSVPAGWVLLALLVIGLGAVLYVGRATVVNAWPPAWRLYATLGIEPPLPLMEQAPSPHAGLSFVDVHPQWAVQDGAAVLVVSGGLRNGRAEQAGIPMLAGRFRSADGETLDVRSADPGFETLEPGETGLFEWVVVEPPAATMHLELGLRDGQAPAGSGS